MFLWFKRLRIKTQLAALSILVLVIICLLTVYSYTKFAHVLEEKNLQANQNLVGQIQKSQEEMYKLFEKMIFNLSYSSSVQSFLLLDDPVKRMESAQNVNNLMKSVINLNEGIEDMVVAGVNGEQLAFSGNLSTIQHARSTVDSLILYSKPNASELMACPDGNVSCMLLTAPVFSLNSSTPFHNHIGFVGLLVQVKTLSGIEEKLYHQKDVILLITDRNGRLIASNNPQFEDTQPILEIVKLHEEQSSDTLILKGHHYLIHREDIPFIAGQLIHITSLDVLHQELRDIGNYEIIILSISVLILSVMLGYIRNNIVRPLRNLMQFMQEIKRDTDAMKRRIDLEGYAEISVVANHFNGMLSKIQMLTDEIVRMNSRMYEIELERQNAQFNFLKSQINPHFLYNTMETIKGLAVMRGVFEIRDIVKSMGQMLRYAVKGDDVIPLFKEIDIVQSYLHIQQFRFQDKIVSELHLDKNTMNYPIPKMLLQPIVENAIYHGLEPKIGKGLLKICSRIIDSVLFLTVEDDGVGMTTDKLAELMKILTAKEPVQSEGERGVGLINVHRRIQLIYGAPYGLVVQSQERVGTTMTITLPIGDSDNV
ncbi:histidine kinase [Paenibacillus marchantiophytorum]|uniref:histidine kinase n=1 Tax=Paenibacillus marchantiophytorum TaxID=1619310 RepID=A0ABQ2BUC9_9BACL|nr:histidine kinase [Paenibacillus marchantiophytorum]GGI46557.1 histidine kinase [Paenibacillus marchantiophytorum]